jgi:hypothetical protein
MREWLASLRLLLTDPQGWSARHYQAKNRMDFAAVQPATWKKPGAR